MSNGNDIFYGQSYREWMRLNDMAELPSDDVDGPPMDQYEPSWEIAK